jgi:ubiquinone/menaquinone biosynthesis C-methylase UbiE
MNARELLREQYKDGSNLYARMRLHARFSTNRYGIFRWIFDQLKLSETARVLELGSGTAQLWMRNADRVPREWKIVLSDFSFGMLNESRANLASIERPFAIAQADAQALPFRDGIFDAVITNFMLYHVPDVPLAMREIRRVLIPDGSCCAATLGKEHLREFDELVRRFVGVPRMSSAASHFGLENGGDLMRTAFPTVEILKYHDGLVVTEAQPLIDYLNSSVARARANAEQENALRQHIEGEIAARGSIHITKDAGLFIASA